jgi:hypothetical protein
MVMVFNDTFNAISWIFIATHTIMTARNMQVAFEDTKGVIRIRKLKKNRQHKIGQKKKDKRSNNHLQNCNNLCPFLLLN